MMNPSVTIESISPENINSLAGLFVELWPECSIEEEYENCKKLLQSEKDICFLVKAKEDYVGFIHVALRYEYVEGATSFPIAYVEGIYLRAAYQKLGLGSKLIEFGEEWGKQKGCRQYASDVEIINENSIEFHKKVGFKEVSRVVCLVKEIS